MEQDSAEIKDNVYIFILRAMQRKRQATYFYYLYVLVVLQYVRV
jgi:hypothetical protein